MTLETLVQLSRSRTPADRSRIQLATAAFGLSGALLLGALRIARMGGGELSEAVYSNYLAESGLRPGLTAILIVLAALTGGLGVQALRLGTAARERRLAALRLAGASRRQVRQLSVTDGAMAGLAGGLLAGPVYLVLSLLFGVLPRMARILPGAELLDVLIWIPVVVLMTTAGVVIGSLLHTDGPPQTDVPPAGPRRTSLIVGPVLIVVGLVAAPWAGLVGSTTIVVGLGVSFLSFGALWIRAIGRWLSQSGDPASLLAGVRLVTDSRPSARLVMMLGCCGFLVGTLINGLAGVLALRPDYYDHTFYATGFGMAVLGLLLVILTAMGALIVGVADQLVDQRRQLACLTALGVDVQFLRRVIRRQLTAVAAPALSAGLLLGMLLGLGRLVGAGNDPIRPGVLISTTVGLTVAGWLLGLFGGAAAGFLLRNQLRDALDPENLRAA
jgi:hypothetical protein